MRGRVRWFGAAWAVAAVGAVVAGAPAARPASAATNRVVLADMRFTPAQLEIEVGDVVVWEAADNGHTVTARDGSFDSSPGGLMDQGDEFRWRFRVPGTYAYFCRVHQGRGMQGQVFVVDPFGPSTTTSTTPRPAVAAGSSTTSTTVPLTSSTAAPTTTTSRPLATSSSTSPAMATPSTVPLGTPVAPQDPPALNPNAPVVASESNGADLPEARAAARHPGRSLAGPVAAAAGALAVLGIAGATAGRAVLRRRAPRDRTP
jgi:plastocyanin